MAKGTKFIIILLFFCNLGFSQLKRQKYIIIEFNEYKVHNKSYYWIINQDSINNQYAKFSFLYIQNFSLDNINECCKGLPIDPYLIYDSTNFSFNRQQINDMEQLKHLLKEKKRKNYSVSKRYKKNGQKINIFFTPIIGNFCFAPFHALGQERTGYKEKISLPISNFTFDKKFKKMNKVIKDNLIQIKYNIIEP